jgi:sugar fermentation stimulation protein A
MNFENKLISGLFIKRYKRFFADIKINNQIITAHCPNTGSMYGLLKKGNKVWLSKSNNPKRKLKYTLEIIQDNKSKVGVNTHSANKIVHQALKNNKIKELNNIIDIKPEMKFGKNTRFDFLITNMQDKAFLEVKNVTLSRKKKLAEFPDAITERGLKHINELVKAGSKKYKIFILFLIQRDDCKLFSVAKDIDPKYANALARAVKKKLNILCYDCKFSSKGIKLNKKIKFKLNE